MNELRNGNFTSSGIVALTTKGRSPGTKGKPFYTYIEECNMERRIGLRLEAETNARPCAWGTLCEKYVMTKNEYIGIEYRQRPDVPLQHPTIDYWVGTPDMTKEDTVCDLKCPWTRKSFCQLVQPLYDGLDGMEAMNKIRETHKEGDTYYFQIVSNAILTNSKYGELLVFCPYVGEVYDILAIAKTAEGDEMKKFYGISQSAEEDVPYLIEGRYYKNFNKIRFEIPQEDKDFLTERVLEAGKLLIPNLQPA